MLSPPMEEKMIKLTAAQRALLANAAAREDGAAPAPAKHARAAAARVVSSLIARKLLREAKSKPGMPVWREDGTGKAYSLVITQAGRAAISDNDTAKQAPASMSEKPKRLATAYADVVSPRNGTKQALIVEMLSQERGATLAALIEATGWLPHTTRAALTGLRKKGFVIERISGAGAEPSAYRVLHNASRAA